MSEAVTVPHVLDGAFERVNRAGEHLSDLHARLEAFRQEHENSVVAQFKTEPPYDIEIVSSVSASIRIPILIGEICYHLRSALDYLIFELAKLDTGVPQDNTQFPIEDTEKCFERNSKRRLRGLNPSHKARIESLQPYAGCDWTKTLREISNPDKHREVASIVIRAVGSAYTPLDEGFASSPVPIRRAPHPVAGEMDMKLDYTATIRFRDGPLIVESLEEIKSEVANTLTLFKAQFK
jgi:hypothetical protein